jgi:putative permease
LKNNVTILKRDRVLNARDVIHRERILKTLSVTALIGVGVAIVLIVDKLLVSFVLAFVMNYLLAPFVNALERAGLSRKLAVTGLFVLMAAVFTATMLLLLPIINQQLAHFKNQLPQFVDGIAHLLSVTETKLKALSFGLYTVDIGQSASRTVSAQSGRIFQELPQAISSSISILLLAPFFAFFMLLDGHGFAKKLMTLVPNNLFEPALNLKHQINTQLGDFIRARLLESGIVGLVVCGGLMLIGFPYAIILGAFAGLSNLIPYIGPVIGAVPALLVAFVEGMPGWTVLMVAAVYLAAQLIDNFLIIPLVVAKIVDLHPILVVIVIIIGAQLGGLLGMIISIPVACILKLTLTTVYQHVFQGSHISHRFESN